MDNLNSKITLFCLTPRVLVFIKIVLSCMLLFNCMPIFASSFLDDLSVKGNICFWNRDRERKNIVDNKSKPLYKIELPGHRPSIDEQLYTTEIQNLDEQSIYDGLAWIQLLMSQYKAGPVELRLDGVTIEAEGNQVIFLQRKTPDYALSNGQLEI